MVVWPEGFPVNNQTIAKVLFTNKLSTRETIEAHWASITPNRNIAEVLRDNGLLDAAICDQVLAFVRKMETPVPASIPEDDDLPEERPVKPTVPPTAPSQPSPAPPVAAAIEADEPPREPARAAPAAEPAQTEPVAGAAPAPYAANAEPLPETVELAGLETGVAHDPGVPHEETVTLAIEGNNPYGSMSGTGQVVPNVAGLESNHIVRRPEPTELPTAIQKGLPKRYTALSGDGEPDQAPPKSLSGDSALSAIISFARQKMATDVYMQPGMPILLRRAGSLLMGSQNTCTQSEVERWIGECAVGHHEGIAPARGMGSCQTIGIKGLGRVRVTLVWSKGVPLLSLRLIPLIELSLADLGLPRFCGECITAGGGLVLVAGGSASGRTTTMYALAEHIARQRPLHLQTVENPVERILRNPKGIVAQMEVGTHVPDSLQGIQAALEDAPEVFLFDGLRTDAELQSLLQLANAGTFVIATTLGTNSLGMLSRLIESCPAEQRDVRRNQIAELLRGVVCQHLIPQSAGAGLVLAVEAFKATPGIASMIRKNDLHLLPSAIAGLKNQGTALDDCLQHLVETHQIHGSEAWSRAMDQRRFQQHRPQHRKK